jgi:ADP-heptose:LPS heptosyltransferase
LVDRILLIHLEDLGDVVLSTPAIRAARRAYPRARIDFITGKAGVAVLQNNPYLDHIIPWTRGRRHLHLLAALPLQRYDATVDFQCRRRSIQLSWMSGARLRVGSDRTDWRNLVYTHIVPDPETARVYVAKQKLEYLRPWGIEPTGAPEDWQTELFPSAGDQAWADEVFERFSLDDGAPVVALSGATLKQFKQWGIENWVHVEDALADAGAKILLTHGPGERDQVRALAARTKADVIWDYGATTVLQAAALMQRCTMWVGNDGGAKHIASAVGLPTVVVNRWRISPIWSDVRPEALQLTIERTPLVSCVEFCSRCPHRSCLHEVTTDDVMRATLAMLARATRNLHSAPRVG